AGSMGGVSRAVPAELLGSVSGVCADATVAASMAARSRLDFMVAPPTPTIGAPLAACCRQARQCRVGEGRRRRSGWVEEIDHLRNLAAHHFAPANRRASARLGEGEERRALGLTIASNTTSV